jgi:hypothetical protein
MSDDWLAQLSQLHEEDKAKRQANAQAEAQKKRQKDARKNQAGELLRQSRAYELLRQVQKALLGGQGLLDILEATDEIDRAITLIWQGPISNARKPDPEDSEAYYHISVEVKEGKLWVNGKSLALATPTALKAALLQASKNPRHQKHK